MKKLPLSTAINLLCLLTAPQLVNATASSITVNATVRDFCGKDFAASTCPSGYSAHPDFENVIANDRGLVKTTLTADKVPVKAITGSSTTVKDANSLKQWYTDTAGVNKKTTLSLIANETSSGSGVYSYQNSNFFPIDGQLLGNQAQTHNFTFSSKFTRS